jgi:hypothetical protein
MAAAGMTNARFLILIDDDALHWNRLPHNRLEASRERAEGPHRHRQLLVHKRSLREPWLAKEYTIRAGGTLAG